VAPRIELAGTAWVCCVQCAGTGVGSGGSVGHIASASSVNAVASLRGGASRERGPDRSSVPVLAEQLGTMTALRVPVEDAVDIMCALSGLDTFLLPAARGWTPQRYEEFVLDSLTHALLRQRTSGSFVLRRTGAG
jgi:hypothetical protein